MVSSRYLYWWLLSDHTVPPSIPTLFVYSTASSIYHSPLATLTDSQACWCWSMDIILPACPGPHSACHVNVIHRLIVNEPYRHRDVSSTHCLCSVASLNLTTNVSPFHLPSDVPHLSDVLCLLETYASTQETHSYLCHQNKWQECLFGNKTWVLGTLPWKNESHFATQSSSKKCHYGRDCHLASSFSSLILTLSQ